MTWLRNRTHCQQFKGGFSINGVTACRCCANKGVGHLSFIKARPPNSSAKYPTSRQKMNALISLSIWHKIHSKAMLFPMQRALRKIRYSAKGHGKRGGARVIYYNMLDDGLIVAVAIYPKNERENLSKAQTGKLAKSKAKK